MQIVAALFAALFSFSTAQHVRTLEAQPLPPAGIQAHGAHVDRVEFRPVPAAHADRYAELAWNAPAENTRPSHTR